jgi:hypothetical protein
VSCASASAAVSPLCEAESRRCHDAAAPGPRTPASPRRPRPASWTVSEPASSATAPRHRIRRYRCSHHCRRSHRARGGRRRGSLAVGGAGAAASRRRSRAGTCRAFPRARRVLVCQFGHGGHHRLRRPREPRPDPVQAEHGNMAVRRRLGSRTDHHRWATALLRDAGRSRALSRAGSKRTETRPRRPADRPQHRVPLTSRDPHLQPGAGPPNDPGHHAPSDTSRGRTLPC